MPEPVSFGFGSVFHSFSPFPSAETHAASISECWKVLSALGNLLSLKGNTLPALGNTLPALGNTKTIEFYDSNCMDLRVANEN